MSAVMLGDIGQLPKATRPTEGVNYRALTGELVRLRSALPHLWKDMGEAKRGELYNLALASSTFQPSAPQIIKVVPRALYSLLRLHRSGQFGDFLDYARTLSFLWDDILSLSENDNLDFQRAVGNVLAEAQQAGSVATLRTRPEIDEWLRSLV